MKASEAVYGAMPGTVPVGIPTAYVVALPAIPTSATILEQSSGVFMRQRINIADLLMDTQGLQGNRYKIYWRPHGYAKSDPTDAEIRDLNSYIFDADEDSECFARLCCHPWHGFRQHLTSRQDGQRVAMFERPFECTCCLELFCCGCIMNPQKMYVRDVAGGTFATVVQTRRNMTCAKWMDVYEGHMEGPDTGGKRHVMSIEMPCCYFKPNCICTEVVQKVWSRDRELQIGRIANIFPGMNVRGCCTKVSNFSVEYPPNLLVGHKLALMGATMLGEYMYFEQRGSNKNNGGGGSRGPAGPAAGAPGPTSDAPVAVSMAR